MVAQCVSDNFERSKDIESDEAEAAKQDHDDSREILVAALGKIFPVNSNRERALDNWSLVVKELERAEILGSDFSGMSTPEAFKLKKENPQEFLSKLEAVIENACWNIGIRGKMAHEFGYYDDPKYKSGSDEMRINITSAMKPLYELLILQDELKKKK